MAKKKETTARGVIKDILTKAWDKVKGKPRSERGTKAEVEAGALKRIADKVGRSIKQVKDIAIGKRPGKNLVEPLKQVKRGRKVEAPPKEEKKVTRKKKPVEKPPEKPPEPPKPPRPERVRVVLKGDIGPYRDDDYTRNRTIRPELNAEQTTAFFEAWDKGDRPTALGIATGAYFKPWPGHIETLDREPEIEAIEE